VYSDSILVKDGAVWSRRVRVTKAECSTSSETLRLHWISQDWGLSTLYIALGHVLCGTLALWQSGLSHAYVITILCIRPVKTRTRTVCGYIICFADLFCLSVFFSFYLFT